MTCAMPVSAVEAGAMIIRISERVWAGHHRKHALLCPRHCATPAPGYIARWNPTRRRKHLDLPVWPPRRGGLAHRHRSDPPSMVIPPRAEGSGRLEPSMPSSADRVPELEHVPCTTRCTCWPRPAIARTGVVQQSAGIVSRAGESFVGVHAGRSRARVHARPHPAWFRARGLSHACASNRCATGASPRSSASSRSIIATTTKDADRPGSGTPQTNAVALVAIGGA